MAQKREISKLSEQERRIADKIRSERNRVFDRFPLLFTLLGSFGLVATFYGFEGMIDKVTLFRENPVILLATGLGILIATGSLYKKLQ